jgi:transposase
VITVRQHDTIMKTLFVSDHGLDQARFKHLKRIAKKQHLSGKPVKGEHSNQANQLRGKINQYAKDKAFEHGVLTVEINPHGTSHYCSRCGAKGERFSQLGGKRITAKWGKLFACQVCHYQTNADQNASKNMHHSFYHEWHWCPQHTPPSPVKPSG